MIVEELLATLGIHADVEAFAEAEGLVGKLKVALGAVAVGLGLTELHHMVKEVAELGDAANKSSQKLGISAESLQELGYAAKLSEISQSSLEGALFRLSKGLEKVSTTGKGPAADAFHKLHLSAKELKGAGLEDALAQIADKFAAMPNGSQKAALAMQIFGGAGKKLIPFLNEGADGIHKLREEAHDLGIVIGDEMAEKFEEFNDDQTRVSEAWKGFKVQIVTDLLPALHGAVTGMLEWLKANSEWIRAGMHAALQLVIGAFQVLGVVVDEVTTFVKTLVTFMDKNRELTEVVAALIVAVLMPALVDLSVALAVVAAEFFAINAPIILVVAAITSLIILVNYWGEIWPPIGAKISKTWDLIADKTSSVTRRMSDGLRSMVSSVVATFADLGRRISDAVGTAFDFLLYRAGEVAEQVWTKIKDIPIVGSVISGVSAVADFAGSGSLVPQVQAIRDQVEGPRGATTSAQESVPVQTSTSLTASFGDTTIVVNPSVGMSEEKIGEIAARKAAESKRDMLGDAYDRLRGGRR